MRLARFIVVFCALYACVFVPARAAEPLRVWRLRDGRSFEAELGAADGLRATFVAPGKSPAIVAVDALLAEDAAVVREWREEWRRPLVVPSRLAPWPAVAVAPAGEVRFVGEEGGVFSYESANFRITSDLRLPAGAIQDLGRVFEATRSALMAVPLGFHAGGERERYPVAMFRDATGYGGAGGPRGSGGYYDGRSRRMLILLPNLGIVEREGGVRLDYARNVFILKHEVTHQLLGRWHRGLPMWAEEGICEFMASLPYAQGRYDLQNPAAGMRGYLLKWSKSKSVRLIPPARLMELGREDWKRAVGEQEAYDYYNSAALLVLYFVQLENGARFAAFLDALRRGESAAVAESTHLLRGKTREGLAAELVALGKRLGVEVGL